MATNDGDQVSQLEKQKQELIERYLAMLKQKNKEIDALKNNIDRLWEVIRQLSEQLNVSSKELDGYREQLKVQDEQLKVQDEQLKVQREQLENFERLLRDIRHTADLRELYIQTLLKQHEMMEAENKRRLDNLQMTRLDEHREYTSKITELNAENASLRSKLITQKEVKSAKTTLEKKELQSSLPEIDTLKAAMTSVLTWLQQIGLL